MRAASGAFAGNVSALLSLAALWANKDGSEVTVLMFAGRPG
jgi:hypothetical protein